MRLRKKSRSLRARSKQAGGGHNSRPRRTASRAAHAGKVVGYLATHALLVVPVELARAFRFRGLFMAAVAERLIPGQPAHADPFRLRTGIELERAGCGAFDDAPHHIAPSGYGAVASGAGLGCALRRAAGEG